MSSINVGVNVGMIATSCSIGAFLTSPVWGYLSDRKGHKLCVLATSICCTVTTLAFGFSTGLKWAIVTRFLQGCSVGQVVVLKGVLKKEFDDTNISIGEHHSSFMFLIWDSFTNPSKCIYISKCQCH